MTDKPTPTDTAAPECLTCSDHGAVGNILTAEPCPDCTRWNVQPAPATQQAADLLAMVSKSLREAYNLGQRYWQQADSEYISQHKKADDTRAKFMALVEETCAALAAGQATAAQATVPPNAIIASIMRDDGGEAPAFCLMAAYRSEKDAMDAFALIAAADATNALRAAHGQAPAGAAEEIDKALNVYAQAFAARVNGWTRQNGDDLPGARSALFAAIHAYAQASTRPTTSPQADNVQEDAARVFTYKNQPCNNVTAWRFGEACRAAQPGGDPIDHGLSLLQKLQERGYGIVAIDAARKQGATK